MDMMSILEIWMIVTMMKTFRVMESCWKNLICAFLSTKILSAQKQPYQFLNGGIVWAYWDSVLSCCLNTCPAQKFL